jgi:tRNA1(Val) A37 N6-methylase TrmN6
VTIGTAPQLATEDAFLGGRFTAVQPVAGYHRAGLDAVLLAAAVNTGFAGRVLDLGAGTGVAGMAVAVRCAEARVVLVERDPETAAYATVALTRPENHPFAARVEVITADIADRAECEAAGLPPGAADAVIMNPPFHDPAAGTHPSSAARAAAYVLEAGLDPWFAAAASLLKARGSLAVIFRADRLDALLAACAGRFGGIAILPVAPRKDDPATRVILSARKGSRTPLRLLPPLSLHGDRNTFLPEADAILRDGASLSDVHPSWPGIG